MLWVLIYTVHSTVCYYHVTYEFQSEHTLYSVLNVKEMLVQNRRNIWSLSDSNGNRCSKVWSVWLNGWVLVNKLNGCAFKSRFYHLNFRYSACLEQAVPWHSGNYRVKIHSETCTWHDNNVQPYSSIFVYIEALLRHIQAYSGILRTMCNLCIFTTCHIPSPGIFRTGSIFKNPVKLWPGISRPLS